MKKLYIQDLIYNCHSQYSILTLQEFSNCFIIHDKEIIQWKGSYYNGGNVVANCGEELWWRFQIKANKEPLTEGSKGLQMTP